MRTYAGMDELCEAVKKIQVYYMVMDIDIDTDIYILYACWISSTA
jgi:hypothetical protein